MLPLIWRRGPKSWAADVDGVAADLEMLNHSTEADFLAVGGHLCGFRQAAEDIRGTIGQCDAASGDHAAEALSAVLQRCDGMRRRVESSFVELEKLRQSADRIRRGFAGLSGMALSFQVAATLGRIETARLGSAGTDLSHLAENVRASAEAISSQTSRAAEIAASLEQRIAAETTRISDLSVQELRALPALTGMVDECLAEFRERGRDERTSSGQLAFRFGEFSEAVGRVVTALQFHDITRQQVEHVVGALRVAASRGRSRGGDREGVAILDLQRRQLEGALESFAVSAAEVLDGLRGISAAGREIAAESDALLGLVSGEQDSFYGRMERCLSRVLQAVSRCVSLESKSLSAVSELEQSIADLERCVGEIQAIGWGFHHLAINTTIEAVHLGGAGEPLSVVASAMQGLQVDARTCAEEAAGALVTMGEAVRQIGESAAAGQAGDLLLRELQAGIEQLHESSGHRADWAGRIRAAVAKLRVDVDRASSEFRVGERFDEVARGCCASLEALAGSTAAPGASAATASELAERYTMDAERAIHRGAIALDGVEPPPLDVAAAASGGFGDNVELF